MFYPWMGFAATCTPEEKVVGPLVRDTALPRDDSATGAIGLFNKRNRTSARRPTSSS
jgi:hypothetical protein